MEKLKWFWNINYGFSIYIVTVFLIQLLGLIPILSNNKIYIYSIDILTLHKTIESISFIYELLQLVLCGGVLLFYKNQRTIFHYKYLGILVLIFFIKIIVFISFIFSI